MRVSIITPSFRNSAWLKLCIASVADQDGVDVEHIVQDAGSDDGTLDWLVDDPRVQAVVEKDGGMYDAVNRGFRRASGEILAYLNCDEQYLPGALKAVHDYFAAHPEVDVLVSDTVITDADGGFLCHRYGFVPLPNSIWARFTVITCALFIRRRVLDEHSLFFDTKWRDMGDFFWVLEAVRHKLRFGELRQFTSAFTETGENMNLKPNAARERALKRSMTPRLVKVFEPLLIAKHRLRMLLAGMFSQTAFDYGLYTLKSPNERVVHHVAKPSARWRRPGL